jgi:hypothetical protein
VLEPHLLAHEPHGPAERHDLQPEPAEAAPSSELVGEVDGCQVPAERVDLALGRLVGGEARSRALDGDGVDAEVGEVGARQVADATLDGLDAVALVERDERPAASTASSRRDVTASVRPTSSIAANTAERASVAGCSIGLLGLP